MLGIIGSFSQQTLRNSPLAYILERKVRKIPRSVCGWIVAFHVGLLMRVPELAARAMGAERDEKDAWVMMAVFESFAVVLFAATMLVLHFVGRHKGRSTAVN